MGETGDAMRLLLLAAALLVAGAAIASSAPAPTPEQTPAEPLASVEASLAAPPALPLHQGAALDLAYELARGGPPSLPPSGLEPRQSGGGVSMLVGADRWHEAGFSGRGVRVAVIDVGFRGYKQKFADTTPPVGMRSFRADGSLDGGSGHGLRAASIVHELAPAAELMLLGFSTIDELAAAVEYAIEEGVDVISFSIGFMHNGPGDGAGPVNEIVDRAVEAGVLWTTAAGNWAQQHWAGPFSDPDGDGVHEFSPGEPLNGRYYSVGDLISASLRWDDEWGAACGDYDLELIGPAGTVVQASRRVQDCDGDPVEGLRMLATRSGRYSARIVAASDRTEPAPDEPHLLSLLLLGSPDRGDRLESFVRSGSLSQPADHPLALSVGVIDESGRVAPFSSRGTTAGGRAKPELVAPPAFTGAEPTARAFLGTSGAAPVVAGAAALLIEALPQLSRDELIAELRERARAIEREDGGDERGADPLPRIVQLGALEGLGPLLPPGGHDAALSGERPPGGGFAAFVYHGPDGYPLRFLHLLIADPQPIAAFHYDGDEQRWRIHFPRAPAWVNDLEHFDDGDEFWLRFAPPE